jgi:hypothetical protein
MRRMKAKQCSICRGWFLPKRGKEVICGKRTCKLERNRLKAKTIPSIYWNYYYTVKVKLRKDPKKLPRYRKLFSNLIRLAEEGFLGEDLR